ncbi:MAG: ATP-binding cassette domain-containing protein [Planctomycetota bacterium]
MSQPSPTSPGANPGEPMIAARGLCKHSGPVRAVQDVGFEIHRGEVVGFLGPNGAGKSTTMKMLTGYLVPDAGEVRIAGRPVLADDLAARDAIGYLPEHTPLYRGMRVDRYLEFVARMRGVARGARRAAVEQVIERCDLAGYTRRRIQTLSKGYKQRVGLAQALIADPDVLILDEPTSGLDPAEIVRIRDLVVELSRDKTILLSTHILPEVEEVCRRALILAGGRLVADGDLLDLTGAQAARLALTLVGAETAVLEELRGIDGVLGVEGPVLGGQNRARYLIEVVDRFEVAERVLAKASKRSWRVCELRHETATLEQVFLKHTRGLAGVASPAEAAQ